MKADVIMHDAEYKSTDKRKDIMARRRLLDQHTDDSESDGDNFLTFCCIHSKNGGSTIAIQEYGLIPAQ